MLEYIMVGMIVALAIFWTLRLICRNASGKGGCNCGLKNPSCPINQSCDDEKSSAKQDIHENTKQ